MKNRLYLLLRMICCAGFVFNSIPLASEFSDTTIATDSQSSQNPISQEVKQEIIDQYKDLPHTFLKNMGQWPKDILYKGSNNGISVRFLQNALSFAVSREVESVRDIEGVEAGEVGREMDSYEYLVWNLNFINTSGTQCSVTASGEQPSKIHFLKGNDPEKWVRYTPEYKMVTYRDLYDDIDLNYYAVGQDLKYDFILKPGARASDIQLRYDGIDSLSINDEGELEVHHPWGTIIDKAPYSCQLKDGEKQEVDVKYIFIDDVTYGFEIVGEYDPAEELIIDPLTLVWSTYMGATSFTTNNYSLDMAIDGDSNVYITGRVDDTYPTTPGVYQSANAGLLDVHVTKIRSDGTDLIYSTLVGGSDYDRGFGIAVNELNQAFVTGGTHSDDFPTTPGAFQPINAGVDSFDAFVVRLNSTGTGLIYSTYLGGSEGDRGNGIAVNDLNQAFVTGGAYSDDFPTTPGAFQTINAGTGIYAAFVARLNSTGTGLIYSTYLGGSDYDRGNGIAVNDLNQVFVTGGTISDDFPTTPGAFQTTFAGGDRDAFVARLNSTGTGLIYSTY
ncbi:SBBP repeat-containing protein, partial [Acidobacteriota bacterium]